MWGQDKFEKTRIGGDGPLRLSRDNETAGEFKHGGAQLTTDNKFSEPNLTSTNGFLSRFTSLIHQLSNLESLLNFIDDHFYNLDIMSTEPCRKQSRRDYSTSTDEDDGTIPVSLLESINSKLAILELLHADIKDLKASLEFSQSQILTLQQENKELTNTVNTLSAQITTLTNENKEMKGAILDLQCRSMRDNLIFSGIPEQPTDDPEQAIKDFMQSALKLPLDSVNNIGFHRVHRLGAKVNTTGKPRAIIAKFEHFKQKELVKSKAKELKGTSFSIYDQYPKEIQERRRILLPIMKSYREKGKRAILSVDKLYVDGVLYRDRNVTTWMW